MLSFWANIWWLWWILTRRALSEAFIGRSSIHIRNGRQQAMNRDDGSCCQLSHAFLTRHVNVVPRTGWTNTIVFLWWRPLLEVKTWKVNNILDGAARSTSYVLVAVLYVFPFDATAQQQLDGFHQIFRSLRPYDNGTPMKIGPQRIFRTENTHFWSENTDSGMAAAAAQKRGGILGKLKQLV